MTGAIRVGAGVSVGIVVTPGFCASMFPAGLAETTCVDTGDVGSTNNCRTTKRSEAVAAMSGSSTRGGKAMTGTASIGGLPAGRLL